MLSDDERQENSNSKPIQKKKKFLARGSGTAGGRKGYDKSKTRSTHGANEDLAP